MRATGAKAERGADRRGSLSRDAVVREAVALLNEGGERGLTFRLLTERLHTGAGAVYWYVENKEQLVDLACDQVLGAALSAAPANTDEPLAALRALAIAVFDQLDRHPWAGPHLSSNPGQLNALRVLERIGRLLHAAGVPAHRQFHAATAMMSYVLGVGTQMARAADAVAPRASREDFLTTTAARWRDLDPEEFTFIHRVAEEFSTHDDREQFIAGLDLLLAGIKDVGDPAHE